MPRLGIIVGVLAILSIACAAVAGDIPSTLQSLVTVHGGVFPIVGQPPTPDPPRDPSKPQPQMLLSPAYVSAVDVTTPGDGNIDLVVRGDLPTPCHRLRAELDVLDPEGMIRLEVGSEAPFDQVCTQVLAPFVEDFELPGLARGTYRIVISGLDVATVDLTGTLATDEPSPDV